MRSLLVEGQTYGVLLQLKDVLELVVKLPTLLAAAYVFHKKARPPEEDQLLFEFLGKPLSLGDWHRIARLASAYPTAIPAEIRSLVQSGVSLFDAHDIPAWRNATIGHGALGFDTDETLRGDIEAKVRALVAHLADAAPTWRWVKVIEQSADRATDTSGPSEPSETSELFQLWAQVGDESWPLMPYLNVVMGDVYCFDYFYRARRSTGLLDYANGRRRREILRQLGDLYDQLVRSTQERALTQDFDVAAHTLQAEEAIRATWTDDRLERPAELINWLRGQLESEDRGVFLLQMERGCGKTSFSRSIDQIGAPLVRFPRTAVRVFYVNDIFAWQPGHFAWSVADLLRSDANGRINLMGEMPSLAVPAENRATALAAALDWVVRLRRRRGSEDRLLLVIDGFDECPDGFHQELGSFVPDPGLLEEGVYVLITARTNAELSPSAEEALAGVQFTRRLSVDRQSDENRALLSDWLIREDVPRALHDLLLEQADFRFLYLRALTEGLRLFGSEAIDQLPRGEAIVGAILDRLALVYGARHFDDLSRSLTVLAQLGDPLTLSELQSLVLEPPGSLRALGWLGDLRGVLRVDRGPTGNTYAIAHEEVRRTVAARWPAVFSTLLEDWMHAWVVLSGELSAPDEFDVVLSQFDRLTDEFGMAEWPDGARTRLGAAIAVRASSRTDTSGGGRARTIRMLTAAMAVLDGAASPSGYVDAFRRTEPTLVAASIEQRLQAGDTTLENLATSPSPIAPDELSFYRALAVAMHRADHTGAAVNTAGRVWSTSRAPRDLANLALILKSSDSVIESRSTMNSALNLVEAGLEAVSRAGVDERHRAEVLYAVGRIFADTVERLDESVGLLRQASQLFARHGDTEYGLAVDVALAFSHFDRGEFDRAWSLFGPLVERVTSSPLDWPLHIRQTVEVDAAMIRFLAVGELRTDVDTAAIRNWELRSYALNNNMIIDLVAGKRERALRHGENGLLLAEERDGVYSRAALLNNLGVVRRDRSMLEAALALCKESGYSIGGAIVAHNLGLEAQPIGGVYQYGDDWLWPCLKNIDVLPL